MMGGYYRASGDDIRFISKARGKGRSFNIPLHNASSSARGLSDFYFFLRHVASSGHLLIIDEPESHLDTANQILLARLLARFVRAGLKVLITTHSDYMIKEINNLVMLSRPFADRNAVTKRLNYSPDDRIEPDSIRAYVAENNGLTRCDVDEFGIDMPVFDTTIDEINARSQTNWRLESRKTRRNEVGFAAFLTQLKSVRLPIAFWFRERTDGTHDSSKIKEGNEYSKCLTPQRCGHRDKASQDE